MDGQCQFYSQCGNNAKYSLTTNLSARLCSDCLVEKMLDQVNNKILLVDIKNRQLISSTLDSFYQMKKELKDRAKKEIALILDRVETLTTQIDQKIIKLLSLACDENLANDLRPKILEIGMTRLRRLQEKSIKDFLDLSFTLSNAREEGLIKQLETELSSGVEKTTEYKGAIEEDYDEFQLRNAIVAIQKFKSETKDIYQICKIKTSRNKEKVFICNINSDCNLKLGK